MSEPEMTLERACEMLSHVGAESLSWRPSTDGEWAIGHVFAAERERIAARLAITIATRMRCGVPYGMVFKGTSIPPHTPPSIPPIERPAHYARLTLQPFDAARAWGLGLALGSAVKYIARHEHKGDPVGDLRKAIACVQDEIEAIENGGAK